MSDAPLRDTDQQRKFILTNMALEHRTSVLVGMVVIFFMGLAAYITIPRESSPEIKLPIYVINTIYSGVGPADIETLITEPIEDELNTIPDVKEIASVSVEGYSSITVTFEPEVDLNDALQKVREKIDLAKPELPPAAEEPSIFEIDFSDFPIMEVNVSGDYDLVRLKEVAEDLQDRLETIASIREVTLSGGLEREVQVDVDLAKLKYYGLDFQDVVDAIAFENVTIPGGSIDVGEQSYLVRIPGEFQAVAPIEDVVVTTRGMRPIYIRDLATVDFGFEERSSYARLDGNSVVTLGIKKRTGENIIATADAVRAEIAALEPTLPPSTRIEITFDESEDIHNMVSNLENNIISGLILVVTVLFFFLGMRNAALAGISIPLSMLLSFLVIQAIGFTLNMVVLFSLILALGMLVDNAVVVVENIYRYVEGGTPRVEAARRAVGEVAMPVIAATLTTLAAFLPLAFWPGVVGEFLKFLPITLIITLSSSLFVALVIIPVLCVIYMRPHGTHDPSHLTRGGRTVFVVLGGLLFVLMLASNWLTAILLAATAAILIFGHRLVFGPISNWFQEHLMPATIKNYERQLRWSLNHPYRVALGTAVALILTVFAFGKFSAGTEYFPEDIPPTAVWVKIEAPVGTRVERIDTVNHILEERIDAVRGRDDIESVVSQSGSASGGGGSSSQGQHLGQISLNFIDYQDRDEDAFDTLERLRSDLPAAVAGVDVRVELPPQGPPSGRPVHVEFIGDDFDVLRVLAEDAIDVLDHSAVYSKLDGLESNLDEGRPELRVQVDREKAALYGLSTQDVGWTVRSAINGTVASTYRFDDDEIDIRVRLAEQYRSDLSSLADLDVVNESGQAHPLSSIASWNVEAGLGGINRKDLKHVAIVSSDVRAGFNQNAVVAEVAAALDSMIASLPVGYTSRFGGQQEDQAESEEFLQRAFLIALVLIAFILISQFNSLSRPLVILVSVLLSTVGVLLGLLILQMPFGIIMSGIGVIALAGIVVNNAIVLIDYTTLLRTRDGLDQFQSLVQGGITRFRPVILTAITTIGGMIPLAVGLNFDYIGLYTNLSPELYWGGEQAAWWGPLAIAVIFGLAFATFLTLILVPVLVRLLDRAGASTTAFFVGRGEVEATPAPAGSRGSLGTGAAVHRAGPSGSG